MKTFLRQPILQAFTACLVLLSMSAKAQVPVSPTPLAGSAITAHSFNANWEPVPGATSYRLDVSTSPTFGAPVTASDLIISEYIEGSAGYHAVEIYNGTGATINLGGMYTLRKETDGSGATTQALITGTMPTAQRG